MNSRRAGAVLGFLAALGFVATAGLHATGYGSVSRLAGEAPAELAPLIRALWLFFSFDLVIFGLIIAAVANTQMLGGWLIVVIAALCPLAAAGLQIGFLGFIGPTAILLGIGILALVAGATLRLAASKSAATAA